MIELNLEGILFAPQRGNGRKGGIALSPDPDAADFLTVNGHVAFDIFLAAGLRNQAFPVRDLDVDGMDRAAVEQAFIADLNGLPASVRGLAAPYNPGQRQHHDQRQTTDPVDRFAFQHIITPYSRRYS